MDQKTECELLRYCLGIGTDEIRAAGPKQVSVTDWGDVIRQSVRHGVTPLLYQRLKTLSPGTNIPASVVHRLREAYLHSAARNMRLYHALAKVLTVLRNDDIPVIVLKGAHLAEVVYGNTALRPMVDVDLLVRGTDLPRVEEKLQEIGYGPSGHSGIGVGRPMSHHLPLAKPDAIPVEIHWSIAHPADPFKIDVDGLWERARPATIAGVEVLVLSPEDLLVHLCLHASFAHSFNIGLRPFCDISETLQHYRDEMDWEQVRLCALQWGAGKCVYLTLYLARELLEAAVPDEVLNAFEPNDLDLSLVIWAKKQIFTGQGNTGLLASNLARMWEANRLQDKVTIFSKVAFPSPEVMATMYPASPFSKRIYLYYPIRLMDLLLRHGRAAWRLLRHDKEVIAAAERENLRTALID